jgi:hypothetical protein
MKEPRKTKEVRHALRNKKKIDVGQIIDRVEEREAILTRMSGVNTAVQLSKIRRRERDARKESKRRRGKEANLP